MGAQKQQKKKGGGGKKLGRSKVRCAAYRAAGKRETNRRKKIMRFLKSAIAKAAKKGVLSREFVTKMLSGGIHQPKGPKAASIDLDSIRRNATEYVEKIIRRTS